MSADDAPRSAADPRPGGEPYYIDSDCPECGTPLVLYDEDSGWNDEWTCPKCQGGLHMDWPDSQWAHIEQGMKDIEEGNTATLTDLKDALTFDSEEDE